MSRQRQGFSSAPSDQDPVTEETIAAVQRWAQALNRQDVDGVMAAMTDDCVFESSYPQPDGTRYEGQNEVRAVWEEFFRASPHSVFETEELAAVGERCIFRWVHRWIDSDGNPEHCRGMDVLRVRDGRVAEKLVYYKRGSPR